MSDAQSKELAEHFLQCEPEFKDRTQEERDRLIDLVAVDIYAAGTNSAERHLNDLIDEGAN